MAPRTSPAAPAPPPSVDGRSATRQRLERAARDVIRRDGVPALTVASICAGAGLSRATFYVHFSGRDEVLATLFLQEARTVIGSSGALVTDHAEFGDLCVEAVVLGLDLIRRNPILQVMFSGEEATFTTRLASTSESFLAMAGAFWHPLVLAAQERGEVRAGLEPDAVVRWLLRVFLSYLEEDPSTAASEATVRREVRTFLLPAFLVRDATSSNREADPERERLVEQVVEASGRLNAAVDDLRQHLS